MKRGLVCGVVLMATVLLMNYEGAPGIDIGKLEPSRVLMVVDQAGVVKISTDLGLRGGGKDMVAAMDDMKQGAEGTVFLDTTEYLLLTPQAVDQLDELDEFLRNSCQVCVVREVEELSAAGEYLAVHDPGVTMRDWNKGKCDLPILYMEGDRMKLAYP